MPSKRQTGNHIIPISPPLKDDGEFKLAGPKRTKKTFQILPRFDHLPSPHVLDAKNEMRMNTDRCNPSRADGGHPDLAGRCLQGSRRPGVRAAHPARGPPCAALCWLLLHPSGPTRLGPAPASPEADQVVSAQTEVSGRQLTIHTRLMKGPVGQSHVASRSQMTDLHFKGPFCGL